MRTRRLFIGIAVATTAVGIGTGVAFAFWSVSGSGQGAGAAAVAQSLTVIPETPANGTLFPGGPAGPVSFEINNPNPYPVEITGVSWSSPTSTNTGSCASSNISIDNQAPTSGLTIMVGGNTTSPLESIPGVLDLAGTAGPGCQAVAFDVVMNVTGAQQA